MHHRVFVYGTLLGGAVNHHRLEGAELLGVCRTSPSLRMFNLGAYPGVARGGHTAVTGEVYRVDAAGLRYLDRLEDYPRLYDRELIQTPFGRAWIYLYRGNRTGRPVIQGGDWRAFAAEPDSYRAAGIRGTRDPKNRRRPRLAAD
jgi:gamma-glutamylcyclotransferase (GGCT)/AIG2-like uncharacterized protein YtfP